MNQLATQQERVPMDSVGVSNTGTGTKIAPQNLGEVVKFAEVMCRADIALPKHLRGNAGACMAVALQALEWQMSPFAVASKSYSVGGAIAYEAQLIAAVVNTRSGIKGRLRYQFEGEGGAMTCTVTGMLDGQECVYTSPPIGSITTKNSPLWKSDPQQQLGYFAARSWARRHCPEVILGVYDRDETEEFRGPDKAKNITPTFDPLSDDVITDESASTDETSDPLTGEIIDPTESDDGSVPSGQTSVADEHSPSGSSAQEGDGAADSPSSASSPSTIPADVLVHFKDFARKALRTADDTALPPEHREKLLNKYVDDYRDVVPNSLWSKLEGVGKPILYVISGDRTKAEAADYIARDLLDCDVREIGGE